MRGYKYMMAQFTFYDRTGIKRILEDQAQKGWLLDKITNYAWRFRRVEPQKVHYAVTYFPKASAYDPGPSEQQRELYDFCAHSGWVLAGTTAQMQVFYNMAENPVPIETDPWMELENIHRSAKKNYLPQDPAPWGADLVYHQYAGEDAYHDYVLCYGKKVVIFRPDWELTAEEMAAAGAILKK